MNPIDAVCVRNLWKQHKLDGKIEFLGLFIGSDTRTRITIRYLCCDGRAPESPSWNNFRKKVTRGLAVCATCATCAIRKSTEDWKRDFTEVLASQPDLFTAWDVVKNNQGEIYFTSICGTCKQPGKRLANSQTINGVRDGRRLCIDCATVERAELRLLNPVEIWEELSKLPGFELVQIENIKRDDNGQWIVSGTCRRNDCGEKVSQTYSNMKNSLANGYTGCDDCAFKNRAEQLRITPEGVLDYAARHGLADCFKNIKISISGNRSWIEAGCNIDGCDGHISTTWDSVRASIRGHGTACCSKCADRSREKIGVTKDEMEELAALHGFTEQVQVLEMVMRSIGRRRKNGSPGREKGVRLQCLVHADEPPFERQVSDLLKSWRDHDTSGCPTCGRKTNGLRHRTDLAELREFVERQAIGPTVKILAIWYKNGMGHARCLCLSQDCNHVFDQQIGWLKEKIPKGSNGCPNCWRYRSSIGETMTSEILRPLSPRAYSMSEDWVPLALWPSGRLRLDFIVGESVIIEIHGSQHWAYIPHLHNNNPANFERQQQRDEWKRMALPRNGFHYIEIDMRKVKSMADLAAELRNKAFSLTEGGLSKHGIDVLHEVAYLCSEWLASRDLHAKDKDEQVVTV